MTGSTVGSLHEAFSVSLPGIGSSKPIVVNGSVVVSRLDSDTQTATVSAYVARTGEPSWSVTLPGTAQSVTDVASDGSSVYVAVLHTDGSVEASSLALADGATRWTTPLPHASALWPLTVAQGRVLVSSSDENLAAGSGRSFIDVVALSTTDGSNAWGYGSWSQNPHPTPQVAAASDGTVLITHIDTDQSGDGGVCEARNIIDGTVRWSRPLDDEEGALENVVASANRFFGSFIAFYFPVPKSAFATSGGLPLWELLLGGTTPGTPPVAVTGRSAIWRTPADGSSVESLDAYSVDHGVPQWSIPLPSDATSFTDVSVASGVLYAVTADQSGASLRTYDVSTGSALATMAIPGTGQPIVANGFVYLVTDNTIHAYTMN